MFSRSKLRQILTKHQEEFQRNKCEIVRGNKNVSAAKNHNKSNNKVSSKHMARQLDEDEDEVGEDVEDVEDAEDGDAHVEGGKKRTTPTLYFSHNEDEQLKSAKTRNNNNNNNQTNNNNDNGNGNEPEQENALNYRSMDIFHRAVSPILILGQCFALMPVMGVQRPNPRHMRFSFKSLQMVITLLFLASSSLLLIAMLKHLSDIGVNAKNFVGLVFFGAVQFACYLFLSLAPKWPRMLRSWTRTELIFTRKPYEMPKRNLAVRVRTAAVIIIFLSMAEHGFYLASAVLSFKRKYEICAPLHNITAKVSFEGYMQKNYDYLFLLVPYSFFGGIFILIINGACTFIWNYMDLFIMMISKGIAYRFEQITARINKLADKEVPEYTFAEIREHYVKMCELLEHTDENLSGIILLSCMNNLYFVCYQLLNIFNKLRWPINYIYFWYSLLYLIGRTAFVFLTAASINDESKAALGVLRRVSSKTWCVEVERLIFQMTTQTVALSGKKFYFLTRSLLFGMAGTIVTYELVLLQFDEPNRSKGLPDLCA